MRALFLAATYIEIIIYIYCEYIYKFNFFLKLHHRKINEYTTAFWRISYLKHSYAPSDYTLYCDSISHNISFPIQGSRLVIRQKSRLLRHLLHEKTYKNSSRTCIYYTPHNFWNFRNQQSTSQIIKARKEENIFESTS